MWRLAVVLAAGLMAGDEGLSLPPRLTEPGGPYAIGRASYHWTDATRAESNAPGAGSRRELMVTVWYPAERGAGAAAAYLPGARAMEEQPEWAGRMRNEFSPEWWPLVRTGEFATHARENAQPAHRPARFPVVLFSHGLGSSGFVYSTLIEHLASRGYVVAAIEHTYTSMATVFPDGRIVPRHRGGSMAEAPREIETGAADLRFVLDRLSQLNQDRRREFALAHRLDLARAAAMGHSLGAEYAARACMLDARFRACVDLDGAMVPVAALPEFNDGARLRQPFLYLEAYHPASELRGKPEQIGEFLRKKAEQLRESPAGSVCVELHAPGMAHPSFSDTPLFFAGRGGFPPMAAAVHNHALITRYIGAFLDQTLLGRPSSLLTAAGADPEAVVRHCGK